jgi:hypothetical protein
VTGNQIKKRRRRRRRRRHTHKAARWKRDLVQVQVQF